MVARAGKHTSNHIHDEIADEYGYELGTTTAGRLKYQLIADLLTGSEQVLDVGCANGIHLVRHAPASRRIVGVDLNDKMLRAARDATLEARNVSLERASAEALPFRDGSFDVAYSFSTLLLVPDLAAAVREMARVLRDGGTAVLDLTGRYNVSQVFWRWWYRSKGHRTLHALSRPSALDLLRRAGLEPRSWHASGFTDQWKYVPVVRKSGRLDRFFHDGDDPDLDYRLSNARVWHPFANRWYIVAEKRDSAR